MSRSLSRDIQRSGNRIGRNINIALRAERVIARRRMAVIRSQTGLLAFAGLVAGIGVIMLNVAVFFWLANNYGNAPAAGIVAAANFAIAVLLGVLASRMSAEKELEPVLEVRDLAMEDIEGEVGDALAEAKDLADNVRRMAKDPFGSAGVSLIGPALSILAKTLKK